MEQGSNVVAEFPRPGILSWKMDEAWPDFIAANHLASEHWVDHQDEQKPQVLPFLMFPNAGYGFAGKSLGVVPVDEHDPIGQRDHMLELVVPEGKAQLVK